MGLRAAVVAYERRESRVAMRAMVLAAGKGTRLSPLTERIPKPLAPVGGVPIIEHIFGLLSRHGFGEAHVNAHHLGGQLVGAYGEAGRRVSGDLRVELLVEPTLSGTAGGAKRLAERAEEALRPFDDTFVVVMGDALTDIDLSRVVRHHKRAGAVATLALVRVEDTSGYGVVEVDARGGVLGFQEKPERAEARSDLASTGVYVFEPRVLDYIPRGQEYDFARDVFPALMEAGERFAAYDASGCYWSDVGTLRAYKQAQIDALTGRVRGLDLPGLAWGPGALRLGPRARVHPAAYARIRGACVVGAGAEVGCVKSISGEVVIGAGCRVSDGAVVEGSVLLPGAVVGSGARVEDCILGPGIEVPAGGEMSGEVVFRAAGGKAESEEDCAAVAARAVSSRAGERAPRDLPIAV